MQEEIESRAVNLAIRCGDLSVRSLISGIQAYQSCMKAGKKETIHGKQTLKELIRQEQSVTSIPVGNGKTKELEKVLNKFGIDYAFLRDKSEEPPKYLMFFKAKDTEVLKEILKECTEREVSRKEHERLEKVLTAIKERAGKIAEKAVRAEKDMTR